MRTLVEAEGPIETSVVRPGGRGVTVDRKATLMVREFKKYGVQLAGISETKWFGEAIYQVDGHTILHSGRPVPDEAPMLRTEGVGIVLDPGMTAAWRKAGEVWKAVSSRIVTARLRVSGHAKYLPSRKKKNIPVFVPGYSPRVTSYHSAVTGHGPALTGYHSSVTGYGPRVTGYHSAVTGYGPV